ncbi:MAG: NTP transferase domain-containing protein [Phycisphaerales bacterium]|nr:NTP transferase domain-containing protein [Phycisphaerales bacterium]
MAALDHWRVIVLGAGRGVRMGTPKALMLSRGEPWWRVQMAQLDALRIRATLVVSEPVAAAIISECDSRAFARPAMAIAPDGTPMFASVTVGVREAIRLSAGNALAGILILPIDTPVPQRTTWFNVVEGALHTERPTCPRSRPLDRDQSSDARLNGHPVAIPMTWTTRELPQWMSPSDGGSEPANHPAQPRLDDLIRPWREFVDVDDPRCVMNLNTPEDLARCETMDQTHPFEA